MKNVINKTKIISGILWKLLESTGTQGAQFLVQIALARILSPEDYSVIAITIIFISIANVLVQNGFSSALIQKKEADDMDFSSVLYIGLCIAGLLYLLLYITAPYIAVFYQNPLIAPVLRVLGISLFFGAFNSIQKVYIARNMLFKKLFVSSLGATILSGAVGILLAYHGFGVWALVVQHLVNQSCCSLILTLTISWRPTLHCSIQRVKALFRFGSKLLASALIDSTYNNMRSLIIGKLYSPTMLSFYNRGDQFPNLLIGNINGSIQSVILPALASQQDHRENVKAMMRRSILTSTFIVFPMMAGLAAIAEPLVRLLLTDKWLPSVPFIRILSISYALWPIHTANLQAINALGRSDIFLKLEIIKKIIGFIILIISIHFGIYAIVWGTLITGIIASFLNAKPNVKLLHYSYKEQWTDILPGFIMSLIMGFVISIITWFSVALWITLLLQICLGIFVYLWMAKLFRLEAFAYLLTILKDFREKIKKRRKEGVIL